MVILSVQAARRRIRVSAAAINKKTADLCSSWLEGTRNLGVSINEGTPNGWFIRENPIEIWMIWGYQI